jgi:hypothetical protein
LFNLANKCARAAEGQTWHSLYELMAQGATFAGSFDQGQKKELKKKKSNKL